MSPDLVFSWGRRFAAGLAVAAKRHPVWALLVVFAVVGSVTGAVLSVGSWPIHVVHQGESGATDIALDPEGYLHVVFAPGRLYYATNAHGGWSVSLLDSVHEVWNAALAVGAHGIVHVAYTAVTRIEGVSTPATVRYVSPDGGGAGSELVDANGWFPDVAVDSADVVHVTYTSRSFALMHAMRSAGTWRNETAVPETQASGTWSALAIDSQGFVHATLTASHSDIGYATNERGGWTFAWLVHDGIANERVPIAVDKDNRVHVAYSGCADGCDPARIIHLLQDGSGWRSEVAATRAILGDVFVDLALDSAGLPHILFSDRGDGSLQYVVRRSEGWRSSIVDRATLTTSGGSIALGRGGRAVVAYSRLDIGEVRSSTSVRVAMEGVNARSFLDFVRGILYILLIEAGVLVAAGLVWIRRSRQLSKSAPTPRS